MIMRILLSLLLFLNGKIFARTNNEVDEDRRITGRTNPPIVGHPFRNLFETNNAGATSTEVYSPSIKQSHNHISDDMLSSTDSPKASKRKLQATSSPLGPSEVDFTTNIISQEKNNQVNISSENESKRTGEITDTEGSSSNSPVTFSLTSEDNLSNFFSKFLNSYSADDLNKSRYAQEDHNSSFGKFIANANCTEFACIKDVDSDANTGGDDLHANPSDSETPEDTEIMRSEIAEKVFSSTAQSKLHERGSGTTSNRLPLNVSTTGLPGRRLLFVSGYGNLLSLLKLSGSNESFSTTARNFPRTVTPGWVIRLMHAGQNKVPTQGWNSINRRGEDIIPKLRRCGIFSACRLKVTASEHNRNTVKVICDANTVSVIASLAIVLSIVIIICNLVIIIVTLRTKSLRKPHGYFKISLALADFINGAFVLSSTSGNLVHDIHFNDSDIVQLDQIRKVEPNPGEAAFFGVCAVMSQVVTVYSVLLLSIDSFLSVRWPMQYRVGDLMTTKRAIIFISAVWIFALAVSALPLVSDGYVTYALSYTTFSYFPVVAPLSTKLSNDDAFFARYIHVIVYVVLVWGIPFIATWILTILTAYYSRDMLRSMRTARKKAPDFSIGRLERDIMRTVSIVLALLTVTVLPMMIALLIVLITLDNNDLCIEKNVSDFMLVSYYILACGSFVNVIVYNACHKEFRRSMFDFICDAITCVFGGCCPKYCDMQSMKSKSFRNRSARDTRRTTLDTRKTGSALELPYNFSYSDRSATLTTNAMSPAPRSRNRSSRARNKSSCKMHIDNKAKERTMSTETTVTSIRNKSMSASSPITPHVFRKAERQRSCSLTDVFLSSNDTSLSPPLRRRVEYTTSVATPANSTTLSDIGSNQA